MSATCYNRIILFGSLITMIYDLFAEKTYMKSTATRTSNREPIHVHVAIIAVTSQSDKYIQMQV